MIWDEWLLRYLYPLFFRVLWIFFHLKKIIIQRKISFVYVAIPSFFHVEELIRYSETIYTCPPSPPRQGEKKTTWKKNCRRFRRAQNQTEFSWSADEFKNLRPPPVAVQKLTGCDLDRYKLWNFVKSCFVSSIYIFFWLDRVKIFKCLQFNAWNESIEILVLIGES